MQRFEPVDPKVNFPELERRILEFWSEHDVFARSIELRKDDPLWVFYEGPPTANGTPGIHHVEARVFKDVYPRFKTMTGHFVPRKGGWDCHGLPVELEVEKEIGTTGKRDIEAFGIAEFNRLCRESVTRYVDEFERLTERIGFWIDMSDAYWTMNTEYIESVWWSLKQLHRRGLLVESDKVTAYCPRCGTALSDAEVAMGYQTVEDPSVFVRFRVATSANTALGDARGDFAARVDDHARGRFRPTKVSLSTARASYALVNVDDELLVVGTSLRERVLGEEGEVVATLRGSDLVGVRYEPLYPNVEGAHEVVAGDFVSMDEGTGIVHIAPAFGPEDLAVGRAQGWPIFKPVDDAGRFNDLGPAFVRGLFVKDADPKIIEDLDDARRAPARGDDRARLPVLLAMRHTAPLLRALGVVRPDHRGEGASARGQRVGQLVPRPHQARALRRLAREQRGLGALTRAVLGHAAADLAVHGRTPDRDRVAHGARRARGARRERRRSASPRDRRGDVPLSGVRGHRDAGPRGDRHLVRLRRHAVRAVGLPPRARSRRGAVRRTVPRRLHQRGDRPDARVVLHADGRGRAALRFDGVPQRRVPGPPGRRRRQEDVEVARQRARPVGGAGSSGRRRAALVHDHERLAVGVAPDRPRGARRDRPPVHAHALERLLVLRDVRQRGGLRSLGGRAGRRRPARARSLGAVAARRYGPRRSRRPRDVRRHRRGPTHRRVRRRPVQLVRPAGSPSLLEPGRGPRR